MEIRALYGQGASADDDGDGGGDGGGDDIINRLHLLHPSQVEFWNSLPLHVPPLPSPPSHSHTHSNADSHEEDAGVGEEHGAIAGCGFRLLIIMANLTGQSRFFMMCGLLLLH